MKKTFTRYVAIGDSTTEGLEDPDGAGGYRGWANRFAEHLARQFGTIEYANLAVRGLEAHQVRREQLGAALAMQPDVATVVAGVNDLLRPRFDADEVAGEVALMIDVLRTSGAEVLSFTMPDMTRVMPLARLLRGRLEALNARLRQTCQSSGALLLDLAAHELGGDPRLWHHDRLHANALGHERIGLGLAHTLGLPGSEGWSAPLPAQPAPTFSQAALAEVSWAAQHWCPGCCGTRAATPRLRGDRQNAPGSTRSRCQNDRSPHGANAQAAGTPAARGPGTGFARVVPQMRLFNVLLVLVTVGLLIWGATHTSATPRQASATKILEHRGHLFRRGEHPAPRPAAWSADQFSIEFDRDQVE